MQTLKHIIPGFVLIYSLFLIGCNEFPKITHATKDTTAAAKQDVATVPVYDPAIDLSIVGGTFTKKLCDTLGVKMFEVTLNP